MAEFKVIEIEKVKEMDYKGEPATILMLTLEQPDGAATAAEMFTTARTPLPEVGGVVTGEIQESQYGPKFRPERKGGNAGFKGKSPEQEKRIVRQHSQEQAIRVMAILGYVLPEEQFKNLVQWFVDDAYGKMTGGTNAWPMNSGVPADQTGLEVGG